MRIVGTLSVGSNCADRFRIMHTEITHCVSDFRYCFARQFSIHRQRQDFIASLLSCRKVAGTVSEVAIATL